MVPANSSSFTAAGSKIFDIYMAETQTPPSYQFHNHVVKAVGLQIIEDLPEIGRLWSLTANTYLVSQYMIWTEASAHRAEMHIAYNLTTRDQTWNPTAVFRFKATDLTVQ